VGRRRPEELTIEVRCCTRSIRKESLWTLGR
jgi:hypothetical protein